MHGAVPRPNVLQPQNPQSSVIHMCLGCSARGNAACSSLESPAAACWARHTPPTLYPARKSHRASTAKSSVSGLERVPNSAPCARKTVCSSDFRVATAVATEGLLAALHAGTAPCATEVWLPGSTVCKRKGKLLSAQLPPHLRSVARIGTPGQLGHAEAQHGHHIDIDAAIAQRRHSFVHCIRMLCRDFRRHLCNQQSIPDFSTVTWCRPHLWVKSALKQAGMGSP